MLTGLADVHKKTSGC